MKTPDFFYEKILLGEAIDKDICLDSPETQEKLKVLRDSNKEILTKYTSDQVKADILKKITNKNKLSGSEKNLKHFVFSPNTIKGLGLASAACLLFALSLGTYFQLKPKAYKEATNSIENLLNTQTDGLGATRFKGSGARLFIYRKDGNQASLLTAGTKVKEKDMLQLSYVAGGDSYGLIISVDGNGVVTRHFPDKGNSAGLLDQSGEIPLNFAYQLDNAPKFERFIFVSGQTAFPIDSIIFEVGKSIKSGFSPSFDLSVLLPSKTIVYDIIFLK